MKDSHGFKDDFKIIEIAGYLISIVLLFVGTINLFIGEPSSLITCAIILSISVFFVCTFGKLLTSILYQLEKFNMKEKPIEQTKNGDE